MLYVVLQGSRYYDIPVDDLKSECIQMTTKSFNSTALLRKNGECQLYQVAFCLRQNAHRARHAPGVQALASATSGKMSAHI